MRILICSSAAPLPPLVDGLRVQIAALYEHLRTRHEVRVVALRGADQPATDDRDEMVLLAMPGQRKPLAKVAPTARSLLARHPTGLRELSYPLRGPLRAELEDFDPDVVHVTQESLAPLGEELEGTPSVLAALDAMHLNQLARAQTAGALTRPFRRLNARNARRLEAKAFRRFGRVVVVSPEDAESLLAADPSLAVSVIANGVDIERFRAHPGESRDPELIVFSGVMDWPPNVAAAIFLAREVMPRVRAEAPDARLAVVGRSPARQVMALDGLAGVDVVGPVDEMRPWLSRARAYACPMVSGTGIKNKLLEAFANGAAAVATPLAIRGMKVEPGRELLIGCDAEELAAHLLALLEDDVLARELGAAAERYVMTHHDWGAVAAAYEGVYREIASSTGSTLRSSHRSSEASPGERPSDAVS